MFFLKKADASSKAEMIAFLKAHDDYTLFLLGNIETYGLSLTEELYSGNFKIISDPSGIIAVFSHTKSGTLLIHSEKSTQALFELILQECQTEGIPLKGVLGEWAFCHNFWNFLKSKQVIQKELFISKEILYSTSLQKISVEKQPQVRLMKPEDLEQWLEIEISSIREMGIPMQGTKEDLCKEFEMKVKANIFWGLFLNEKLVSMACLNARALDLGQVGDVYTVPEFRKQGFCTAVMRQLVYDAKEVHHLRKLIIFTAETNLSARKVYESLGVVPVGYYALLFGE